MKIRKVTWTEKLRRSELVVAEQAKTIAELRTMSSTLRKDLDSSEKANLDVNGMRMRMYDSLMLEKMDLMGRIGRIDQRIAALGLQPATNIAQGLDLKRFSEHAARVVG